MKEWIEAEKDGIKRRDMITVSVFSVIGVVPLMFDKAFEQTLGTGLLAGFAFGVAVCKVIEMMKRQKQQKASK